LGTLPPPPHSRSSQRGFSSVDALLSLVSKSDDPSSGSTIF
jgi:hypothetical protein